MFLYFFSLHILISILYNYYHEYIISSLLEIYCFNKYSIFIIKLNKSMSVELTVKLFVGQVRCQQSNIDVNIVDEMFIDTISTCILRI